MRRRQVLFAPEAVQDLEAIYTLISEGGGSGRAQNYLARLESHCLGFDLASERGTARDDIRPGLRITSFDRRITIAFKVTAEEVVFLRLFYAGANWQSGLAED